MTDLNNIKVIPFCSKVDEWPIWIDRPLAKSERHGFKDLLLGEVPIPKEDEEFDEVSYIKLNEMCTQSLFCPEILKPV